LIEKTACDHRTHSDLNLSRDEAKGLADLLPRNAEPKTVGDCWAKMLLAHVFAIQQTGPAGAHSYEMAGV